MKTNLNSRTTIICLFVLIHRTTHKTALKKNQRRMPNKKPVNPLTIYLYVPNLIGYVRVITLLLALWLSSVDPIATLVLYTFSFILDAADGMAARALNQCSKFGMVLDMIIDRAATSAFLCVLAPLAGTTWAIVFAVLVGLDITSHFARMYVQSLLGMTTHKDAGNAHYTLLALYYNNKMFMGALCVGQEFLYLWAYWALFSVDGVLSGNTDGSFLHLITTKLTIENQICGTVFLFLCAGKQLVNVLQLLDAMQHLAKYDVSLLNK